MAISITGQGAPKSARYGTSAQQEATASKSNSSTRSAQSAVAAYETTAGKELPPEKRVQAVSTVEKAVTKINDYVKTVSRDLQFSFDEELPLGRAVIRVLDTETKEVIREIPSEEVVAIAQRINEQLTADDEVDSFIISETI